MFLKETGIFKQIFSASICYSEICGRQLFHNGDSRSNNFECLLDFIKYMGGKNSLTKLINYEEKEIHFTDAIRNGLVHEYFLKTSKGGVALVSQRLESIETGFYIKDNVEVYLIVVPYYNLFCNALIKAQKERKISDNWKRKT
ncbi:MAG: hypothetical protein HOC24_08140 [Deltaproteobacteria bacterium]|jgi:hypothetical protein|nr:hypothetical protein [Deltaproteobacteria bacterium]